MRKKLSGTTLIEVITAMTIIIIVSVIAYMGISASASFIRHGTDIRNAGAEAEENMERSIIYGDGETMQITYTVGGVKYTTEADKIIASDDSKTTQYICYIPHISEE